MIHFFLRLLPNLRTKSLNILLFVLRLLALVILLLFFCLLLAYFLSLWLMLIVGVLGAFRCLALL
jgi:hypothetical protein